MTETDLVIRLRNRNETLLQEAALLESAANEIEKLQWQVRELIEENDPIGQLPSCEIALKQSGNIFGLPSPSRMHGPEAESIRTLNFKD